MTLPTEQDRKKAHEILDAILDKRPMFINSELGHETTPVMIGYQEVLGETTHILIAYDTDGNDYFIDLWLSERPKRAPTEQELIAHLQSGLPVKVTRSDGSWYPVYRPNISIASRGYHTKVDGESISRVELITNEEFDKFWNKRI